MKRITAIAAVCTLAIGLSACGSQSHGGLNYAARDKASATEETSATAASDADKAKDENVSPAPTSEPTPVPTPAPTLEPTPEPTPEIIELTAYMSDWNTFQQMFGGEPYYEKGEGVYENWTVSDGIEYANYGGSTVDVVVWNDARYSICGIYPGMSREDAVAKLTGQNWTVQKDENDRVDLINGAASFMLLFDNRESKIRSISYINPPVPEVDKETAAQLLADYCNNLSDTDGKYNVSSSDKTDPEGRYYYYIVRYVMTDEEVEEILANGGVPMANIYIRSNSGRHHRYRDG